MIRLIDAITLAGTKLRAHKIRTGVTVAVSALLFGTLAFVVLVFDGVEQSVEGFRHEGLGDRYILSVNDISQYESGASALSNKKEVIARAEAIQKQIIANKTSEAKRLQIDYDPKSEPPITDGDSEHQYLNFDMLAARRAVNEYIKQHPPVDSLTKIKQVFAQYHPKDYFSSSTIAPVGGKLVTMFNGKEEQSPEKIREMENSDSTDQFGTPKDPIRDGLQMMDGGITQPFLIKNMSWRPESGEIPVIITAQSAEKLLELPKLAAQATPHDKVARAAEIRSKVGVVTIDACYRNTSSSTLISNALSSNAEIAKNKGNKDYQKPHLIYGLPTADSCGAAIIKEDTRTKEEKNYTDRQNEFDRKFNGLIDPVQTKLRFRVVGITPGFGSTNPGFASDIVTSLLSSTLGNSWVVPRDLYEKITPNSRHEDILLGQKPTDDSPISYAMPPTYFAEFDDVVTARDALHKTGCALDGCTQSGIVSMPFGSGSIVIAEVRDAISKYLIYAAFAVAVIAMLIMAGTIGRMISDSRRETAVFRAIGAKRSDISMIYLVYSMLLSGRVAMFCVLLGGILAAAVDYFFSADATATAQAMLSSGNQTHQFHFIGIGMDMLPIIGLIFATGFISMILPLLRNIRRNPINDMRDE